MSLFQVTKKQLIENYELRTMTGDIVSFTPSYSQLLPDPFSDLNVTIDVEASQDLHGYDHPWIGGAGKNKLRLETDNIKTINTYGSWSGNTYTHRGITITIEEDNDGNVTGLKANGTATGGTFTMFLDSSNYEEWSGSYIMNGCYGGSGSTYFWDMQAEGSGNVNCTNGDIAFNPNQKYRARLVVLNGSSINITLKPMIRLASESDDSFAPYSNICTISSHNEANITRCGVNLWDEQWELGTIDNSGADVPTSLLFRSKGYIKVEPNKTYYCYCGDIIGVAGASLPLYFYDENKNFISRASVNNDTFTTPNNACFVRFRTGTDFQHPNVYQNDISINYPSTDTTYHPYNGQTYAIAFGQTVYGGVLDVTRGKLTVTHAIVDLGSLSWVNEDNSASGQARVPSTDIYPLGIKYNSTPICTIFLGVSPKPYNAFNNGEIGFSNSESQPFIRARTPLIIGKTDAEIKAFMNGVMFVYELATPFDIDLTPEVISAIVGTNNVFADCGQTTVTCLI